MTTKRPPLYDMFLNSVTTADNTAIDSIRLGMVVSGLSIIGLAIYDVVVNKNAFDALTLGGGLACVFGGGGFGLAAKSRDEVSMYPEQFGADDFEEEPFVDQPRRGRRR